MQQQHKFGLIHEGLRETEPKRDVTANIRNSRLKNMCDVAVYLGHDHVQSRFTVTRQLRSLSWLCSNDSVGRLYRSLPGNMSLSKGHSDSEAFTKLAAQIVRARSLNPKDVLKLSLIHISEPTRPY